MFIENRKLWAALDVQLADIWCEARCIHSSKGVGVLARHRIIYNMGEWRALHTDTYTHTLQNCSYYCQTHRNKHIKCYFRWGHILLNRCRSQQRVLPRYVFHLHETICHMNCKHDVSSASSATDCSVVKKLQCYEYAADVFLCFLDFNQNLLQVKQKRTRC